MQRRETRFIWFSALSVLITQMNIPNDSRRLKKRKWDIRSKRQYLFTSQHDVAHHKHNIMRVGGNWQITNIDLANKYTIFFQKFVNTINFETLQIENLTKRF
jgi:hypothetical protein